MDDKEKLEIATRALRRIGQMLGTFSNNPLDHMAACLEENQALALLALLEMGEQPDEMPIPEGEVREIARARDLEDVLREVGQDE